MLRDTHVTEENRTTLQRKLHEGPLRMAVLTDSDVPFNLTPWMSHGSTGSWGACRLGWPLVAPSACRLGWPLVAPSAVCSRFYLWPCLLWPRVLPSWALLVALCFAHVLHAGGPVCSACAGSICWSLSCSRSAFCGSVRAGVSHLQVVFATDCDLRIASARGPHLPFLLVAKITCGITVASVAPSARRLAGDCNLRIAFGSGLHLCLLCGGQAVGSWQPFPLALPWFYLLAACGSVCCCCSAAVVLSAERLWLHLLFRGLIRCALAALFAVHCRPHRLRTCGSICCSCWQADFVPPPLGSDHGMLVTIRPICPRMLRQAVGRRN